MQKKLRTKKTLQKRVRITKNGKIVRKHTSIGHLKRKWGAARKSRKTRSTTQDSRGHQLIFKKLLGSLGKMIK